MLPNYEAFVWDHLQSGVTDAFVSGVMNATSGSEIDGVYFDTASCYDAPGQADATLATMQALQKAAPNLIIGFHTGSDLFGSALGTAAAMDYTFAEPNATKVKKGGGMDGDSAVSWLDGNYAGGVISLAHMGATMYSAEQNYSLAVFLAGANALSYYAFSSSDKSPYSPAWADCAPMAPTWPVFPTWCAGMGFSPDFFRPLGAPAGPATPTGGARKEVVRKFASGTTVTVELKGSRCRISWADGAVTTCV
jgi:hypothetical protein